MWLERHATLRPRASRRREAASKACPEPAEGDARARTNGGGSWSILRRPRSAYAGGLHPRGLGIAALNGPRTGRSFSRCRRSDSRGRAIMVYGGSAFALVLSRSAQPPDRSPDRGWVALALRLAGSAQPRRAASVTRLRPVIFNVPHSAAGLLGRRSSCRRTSGAADLAAPVPSDTGSRVGAKARTARRSPPA
jgi:hypothetical protein